MYQRVLVPTDGSEMSTRALQAAASLARLTGARLEVLSVKEPFPYSAISEMQPVPPQEFFDAQERTAQARVTAALEAARRHGAASLVVSLAVDTLVGDPARTTLLALFSSPSFRFL